MDLKAKTMIGEFFDDLDRFIYPQPLVCDTVNVSRLDLDAWRKRGLLLGEGWEKDGRVMHTGRSALWCGVMAELAPIIGPTEASRHAETLLMHSPLDRREGMVATINPRLPRWKGDEAPEGWETVRQLALIPEKQFADQPIPLHALVVFPVGHLFQWWALGMRTHVDAAVTA